MFVKAPLRIDSFKVRTTRKTCLHSSMHFAEAIQDFKNFEYDSFDEFAAQSIKSCQKIFEKFRKEKL